MVVIVLAWLGSFLFPHPAEQLVHGDTLDLETVEVRAFPWEKYSLGYKVNTLGEEEIGAFQGQALSELLQRRTGIFVREYGAGMLATLNMRGTAAGHNAVFWNGLPINSPSLGQMDFSLLTVGSCDAIRVQYGGSGALFGTDAIGGSIHLGSQPSFAQGHKVKVRAAHGSFGLWQNQVEHSYSNQKFFSHTRAYINRSANNFPYRNLGKAGTPVERQEHASVHTRGLVQDLAWNVGANTQVSSSFWYHFTDREILPVMGSNTRDVQEDANVRWVADLRHFRDQVQYNLKLGYVEDDQVFNLSTSNITRQYFIGAEAEWQATEKMHGKSGARLTHIVGELSTYYKEEQRLELYHSHLFHLGKSIEGAINLRQMVVDGEFVPFTPSLGLEWGFFDKETHNLTLKGAASKNFKVPTLNDRFWSPGGNPDLLPEKSLSAEMGVVQKGKRGAFNWEAEVNYYHMLVDQWIVWLPGESFWTPVNIRKVRNQGIESSFSSEFSFSKWDLSADINYSYVQARIAGDQEDAGRSIGNQLPYTPFHKGNSYLSAKRGPFSSWANYTFVGDRYVGTDNSTQVNAFALLDAGINYTWTMKAFATCRLGIQVNNFFDNDYQVLRLRPMPGRNYQINITIDL
ncbi:TonB-dependent receptor [Pleomorphovibrio marinus]|uniref:TonB-dependent receptor n=1 Tax=Pleomorphovibrio marinus TaxID=2164132 RepID=UPI001E3D9D88|nr:TonB-dependent receptor [Pleomorphovibrio marinus]